MGFLAHSLPLAITVVHAMIDLAKANKRLPGVVAVVLTVPAALCFLWYWSRRLFP